MRSRRLAVGSVTCVLWSPRCPSTPRVPSNTAVAVANNNDLVDGGPRLRCLHSVGRAETGGGKDAVSAPAYRVVRVVWRKLRPHVALLCASTAGWADKADTAAAERGTKAIAACGAGLASIVVASAMIQNHATVTCRERGRGGKLVTGRVGIRSFGVRDRQELSGRGVGRRPVRESDEREATTRPYVPCVTYHRQPAPLAPCRSVAPCQRIERASPCRQSLTVERSG